MIPSQKAKEPSVQSRPKTMKPKIILCLAFVFSGGLLGCSTTAHHSIADQWGSATNGLQMSLAILMTGQRDDPEFEVSFRNMGAQDVCLNQGIMLDNGRVELPDKIHLNLLDGSGRNRELYFSDRSYPGVSGRMDDYVVPLRSR